MAAHTPSVPDVSIIIPNRDSPLIGDTLRSILAQTALERVLEILVVGTDQPGLVIEHDQVHFIRAARPLTAPVARNIGIRSARGSYLAFIDADCLAAPDWLAQLLAARRAGHAIVGGGIALEGSGYWQLCYNLTMFHDFLTTTPAGERPNLGTLNLGVSRSVVERVGLFDERLTRSQDTEWTLRMRQAGYRLYFAPQAVVQHRPAISSLRQIVRVWYMTGSFSVWIRRRYRDIIAVPPLARYPALLIAAAPLIGLAVTARIFGRSPHLVRYIHTWPVVWATKVAWCLGAANAMHDPEGI